MAAPIAAGILAGLGAIYAARIVPRIVQRVSAAEGRGATLFSKSVKPYHPYECGFQQTMSEKEAYMLLGFSENEAQAVFQRPPPDEVKKRYRKMMKEFHSDAGGTPYIATKLNEARDVLTR